MNLSNNTLTLLDVYDISYISIEAGDHLKTKKETPLLN